MRLSVLLILAGCLGSKTDAGDDTDVVDTDTTVPCDATIATFDPANGATEVPRDQIVQVTFSAPVAPENPWSLSLAGIEGSAELAADGLSATFTPDAPLPSDTSIQVQADVCDDAGIAAFTTRFAVDADSLAGRTYAVNYGAVNFITPPLANALNPADWILVQIDQVDAAAETLTTFAGLANGAVPEPDCLNSFDSGVANFDENPVLTVGPTDFVIPFGTDTVTIEDFVMDGRFGPGAGVLNDVTISGNLDTRGITTINGVCAISALSGAPCGPCRDGVMQCLPVQAEAAQADYWAEVDLQTTCGF